VKVKTLLVFITCSLLINFVYGDNYPINRNIDILHYRFELNLSDHTDEILGVTTITLLFKTDGTSKIRLDLVNQTDSLQGKGMRITEVSQMGKTLNYVHAQNVLWVDLGEASKANTETHITIAYHGVPADGLRIGKTKYGDRSFFNENWPNRARHWLPTVDHPYEKATSEFIVTAPVRYQVISNGLLQEETILDTETKRTHYRQSVPVSSWLYVLGVAEFAVQYVDPFKGKSIETWVYRQDRDKGFYDFAEPTKQVVGFFEDYVGPYVYEKIANVQTPSVHGGMETSSAIFYGEDLIDGTRSVRLRNIVIHELAHQWFGNAVTESSWDDAWLSEGFATYFTMLFIEHAYGRDEFVDQLHKARKVVYDMLAQDPDYKIVDDRSPEIMPVTNALTYQKGAWILHMLRNRIGDSAFQRGIRDYYRNFVNGNASTQDFRLALERASGQDLEPFFRQWLYQGGGIALKGTWHYDEKEKLIHVSLRRMKDKAYDFDFSLEIGVYHQGEVFPDISTHDFKSGVLEVTWPSDAKPEKIVLDPRTILLATWDFDELK
jgi:aminopeptidase N